MDVLLPVIVIQVGLIVVLVIIAVVVKLYVIRRFRSGRKNFIVNTNITENTAALLDNESTTVWEACNQHMDNS